MDHSTIQAARESIIAADRAGTSTVEGSHLRAAVRALIAHAEGLEERLARHERDNVRHL